MKVQSLIDKLKEFDTPQERVTAAVTMFGISFVLSEYECIPGDEFYSQGFRILYRQYLTNGEVNCIPAKQEISFIDLIDALRAQEKERILKRSEEAQRAYSQFRREYWAKEKERYEAEQLAKKEKRAAARAKKEAQKPENNKPLADILKNNFFKHREEVLGFLTEKEAVVLFLRTHNYTLRAIGEILILTQESVRRIEYFALRKLRHPDRVLERENMFTCLPGFKAYYEKKSDTETESTYGDRVDIIHMCVTLDDLCEDKNQSEFLDIPIS